MLVVSCSLGFSIALAPGSDISMALVMVFLLLMTFSDVCSCCDLLGWFYWVL